MTEQDGEARRLIESAFPERPRNLAPGYVWCKTCCTAVPAPLQRAGLCHRPGPAVAATHKTGR